MNSKQKGSKKNLTGEKPEVVNLAFDDTATAAGVPEEATPTTDKKYSEILVLALSHIMPGCRLTTDKNIVAESKTKLVIVAEDELAGIGLRKRGYIYDPQDTKYLRIAVREDENQLLKHTLQVFHKV